jgi:ATP/ADP translocase
VKRAGSWVPVRHGEWRLVAATGSFAFLAVALAIVLRTWSDAVFLTWFDASWVAWLFVATAVVFVPATFGYAWVAPRLGAVWLNTLLLGAFGVATVACARFAQTPEAVFAAVLVVSVFSPLANVICWNTVLDRLDARQARRLLPVIGGISTLGAIGGGLVGGELAALHGNEALVWLAFSFLICMMPLPLLLSAPLRRRAPRKRPAGIQQGFRSLARNRLIGIVAAGTFLMALSTNVIDYQFKAHAQAALPGEALGTFFARFHGAANLAVLLVQFGLAPLVMRRFGVGAAFALHPFVLVVGAFATLAFPVLGAVVALRFVDTVLKFTFHKNSNDLALSPVRSQDRHQAMVFLKGVVYPLGGIAAGLVLAGSAALGFDLLHAAGFWVMLLASLWLLVARQVRVGYMEQIGRKLSIEIEPTRPPSRKSAAALMESLRMRVEQIRGLQRQLRERERRSEEVDPKLNLAIQRALDGLFSTMADLVGDARAVEAAAERYLHGDGSERATAVELLDTLLDTHRIPDAADLLDSLLRDRTRGLLAPT